jgi:hypothetical protein
LVESHSSGNGAQIHARPLVGGGPASEKAQTFVLPRDARVKHYKWRADQYFWSGPWKRTFAVEFEPVSEFGATFQCSRIEIMEAIPLAQAG